MVKPDTQDQTRSQLYMTSSFKVHSCPTFLCVILPWFGEGVTVSMVSSGESGTRVQQEFTYD